MSLLKTRLLVVLGFVSCLIAGAMIVGCGEAGTGIMVVKNLTGEKSLLKVSLDGQEAKQNTLAKAATGHSNWDIKDRVSSDNPKLSYKITNPEKMGRITYTVINITQEFQGNYSAQAEFIVAPRDNKPESQIKENVVYDLGKPPAFLKVMDVRGNEVKGVKLIPGKKYQLMLVQKADRSETANIYFKTK
jgi:hypothetical protein